MSHQQSHRFQDPITKPDGRTIGDAAEYAIRRPKKVRNTEPGQRAARVLNEASEHGGPFGLLRLVEVIRD